MTDDYVIRVQLVNRDTGSVFRSFDVEGRTWLESTELYDRMQKIMGGKPTK